MVAFARWTGGVELWGNDPPQHVGDLLSRRACGRGSPPAIVRVAYSPDGRRLAAADQGGTATIWEVDTPNAGPRPCGKALR